MCTFLKIVIVVGLIVEVPAALVMIILILQDMTWYRSLGAKFGDLTKAYDTIKSKKVDEPSSKHRKIAQDKLRKEKEESARKQGFFEEPYFPGFHRDGRLVYRGHNIPTNAALEFYRKMDELEDTQIFSVVEEV